VNVLPLVNQLKELYKKSYQLFKHHTQFCCDFCHCKCFYDFYNV